MRFQPLCTITVVPTRSTTYNSSVVCSVAGTWHMTIEQSLQIGLLGKFDSECACSRNVVFQRICWTYIIQQLQYVRVTTVA